MSSAACAATGGPSRPADLAFGAFWQGELDPISYSCLASFPAHGLRLRVYSYQDDLELPPGVELADARRIVPDASLTDRFLFRGRPVLSKFANLFRYRMIADTGLCWTDADMLCLRPPRFGQESMIFGRQEPGDHPHAFNTALLWLSDGPLLSALIEAAAAAVDAADEPWGSTGPALMTRLVRAHGLEDRAAPISRFYPAPWHAYYKPLLAGFRAEMETLTAEADFLHLWNVCLSRNGYDRASSPPAGSFLHAACERLGTLGRFARAYDEAELAGLLKVELPASA